MVTRKDYNLLCFTYIMNRRTTFMLDDKIEGKLRIIQAKTIKDTGGSFSFSTCINQVLEKGLV
jgi:hypothetical protein